MYHILSLKTPNPAASNIIETMNKFKLIVYDKIRFLKIKKNNFTKISVDVNIQTSPAHFVAY